jgi:predicted transcriptional regulator
MILLHQANVLGLLLQPLLRAQQVHKVCKVPKVFRVEMARHKAQLAVKDPRVSKVHRVYRVLKESALKVCRVFKVMVSKAYRVSKVLNHQGFMDQVGLLRA